MGFCKIFLFATLFLFQGTFGHRFERHATKNVTLEGLTNGSAVMHVSDNHHIDKLIASDVRTNVQQDGDDLMLTGNGNVEVEVDKNNPELKFEFCTSFLSRNCFDKTVTVCYDAERTVESARRGCHSDQCRFVAGVSESQGSRYLWVMSEINSEPFTSNDGEVCISAVMKWDKAVASLDRSFASCQPKFYDGNMVKLSGIKFMDDCYLKIKHAKQWFPTTTPPPTTPEMPSTAPSTSETTDSSTANTIWIVVGIFAGIVLIIIGLVILYCFCYKKKKSIARTIEGQVVEPLPELPEMKTITEIEKLTVEDEDAGAKGKTIEEKKEAETVKPGAPPKEVPPPSKPARKEKKKKEKKVVVVPPPKADQKKVVVPKCSNVPAPKEEEKQPAPKPAKMEDEAEKMVEKEDPKPATVDQGEEEQKEDKTQEEPAAEEVVKKVCVKAPVEDGTIDTVIGKQPVSRVYDPFVLVPSGVLRPFSSKIARSQYKGSLRSGKRNSLSDSEDPYMFLVIESESRKIKKIGFSKLDKSTKDHLEAEMDKFFPNSLYCTLDSSETVLFCCPMNTMLAKVEKLLDTAEERMTAYGCEFDEFGCMTVASDPAKEYLGKSSTPSFYRSFAFGGIYRDYIDPFVGDKQIHSIPLLFSIAMQRRYSSTNRLEALTFIRKQMPIVKNHFTAQKCRGFSFPVCAIEASYKMNPAGFKLQEENPTQPSKTRKSEKRSKKPTTPKRKVKLIEW